MSAALIDPRAGVNVLPLKRGVRAGQCPRWVKSGHVQRKKTCPHYPRKRTSRGLVGMSAKCQKRTSTGVRLSTRLE